MVAIRAEEGSTRTVGAIGLQLGLGLLTHGVDVDSVLSGPTNEMWIDPWVAHLTRLGVVFQHDAAVRRIHTDGQPHHPRHHRAGGPDGRHHRRLLRGGAAGGGDDVAADRRPEARGPVDGQHRPAPHGVDERHPVLPRAPRAHRPWTHRLRGFTVGADLGVAGSVLGLDRPVRVRRRRGQGHPVGGHLGLGDAGHALRPAREGVRRGRDQERGLAADSRAPRRRRAEAVEGREDHAVVPRSRHRVSEPLAGGQPRAAPDQHRGLACQSPARLHRDREPVPGCRLREDGHRPRVHGVGERGGPPGRERSPRSRGVSGTAGGDLAADRAVDLPPLQGSWDRLVFEQGAPHSLRSAAWAAFRQWLPLGGRRPAAANGAGG